MTPAEFTRDTREFTYLGRSFPVFCRGSGPGVLVLHELFGVTPEVLRFAAVVAAGGFTVWVPVLFGWPNRPLIKLNGAVGLAGACIRREIHLLAAKRSSPITDTLRALGRALHEQAGEPGIGVVGMCLTGNFALAMAADSSVLAPVCAQPSLPRLAIGKRRRESLHLSRFELEALKRRSAVGLQVLGLRFKSDSICPAARFDRLESELKDSFIRNDIPSPDPAHGIRKKAHAVLTVELRDDPNHPTQTALRQVLAFLHEKLKPQAE